MVLTGNHLNKACVYTVGTGAEDDSDRMNSARTEAMGDLLCKSCIHSYSYVLGHECGGAKLFVMVSEHEYLPQGSIWMATKSRMLTKVTT